LRRALLHLVTGVVVLDAIALGVYYLAGIEHASPRTRMYFTAGWTVVTLIVVLTLLQRLRKLRYSR
jgi:hypothetical protein